MLGKLAVSPRTWRSRPEVLVRTVAAMTAGYGMCLVLRPEILARPAGLTVDGVVPDDVAALTRSIGVRDVVLSMLTVVAPAGRSLAAANAARVVADTGDAVWFGHLLKDPAMRAKVSGSAAAWAALGAAVGVYAWRRGEV